MQISYEWLMELLPEPIAIEKLEEILTNIGLEVEAVETIEKIKGNLNGVVVGEVVECIPHPNADKLKLTKVNIGNEIPLSVVCGAPNVATGQKVLVATVGTTLYGMNNEPLTIKAAKIRGEQSEGMICAEDELGIGTSHDGIMILPDDVEVGTEASIYFDLPEAGKTIHIGLTPNRSDAMSHIGVAKDVIAYLNHHNKCSLKLNLSEEPIKTSSSEHHPDIQIESDDKCKRYAGVVIENIEVTTSPEWIQRKLIAVGLRPINNIVDVTNLVLMELGQPLHAFDLEKINGPLSIKTADEDAIFTTLDGKEKKLSKDDLVIADENNILCIAGVMGSNNSGVTSATKNIFLESAYFDPTSVRKTSQLHQLRSDAALRFEKTANIDMVIPALQKAIAIITQLNPNAQVGIISDIYKQKVEPQKVVFSFDEIRNLCGKNYASAVIICILKDLGFTIEKDDEKEATVIVPFSKNDITQSADIAEEIIRIDGLNNIEIPKNIRYSLSTTENNTSSNRKIKKQIAEWLTANGLHEIITNSITDKKNYQDDAHVVKMINSLSSELNAMRPEMLISGLEVLSYNINRKNANLGVYEFGNIYSVVNGTYKQEERLAIWLTGERYPKQWSTESEAYNFYYLKGLIAQMWHFVGIQKVMTNIENDTLTYLCKNQNLAQIRQVETKLLNEYGIAQDVYYADINVKLMIEEIKKHKNKYSEINKFPIVKRDLALILDKSVTYQDIEKATIKSKVKELINFHLFDIYEGEQLGDNKRSWAINYQFESKEKTFTDSEIEQLMKSLTDRYEKELNALVRQ